MVLFRNPKSADEKFRQLSVNHTSHGITQKRDECKLVMQAKDKEEDRGHGMDISGKGFIPNDSHENEKNAALYYSEIEDVTAH